MSFSDFWSRLFGSSKTTEASTNQNKDSKRLSEDNPISLYSDNDAVIDENARISTFEDGKELGYNGLSLERTNEKGKVKEAEVQIAPEMVKQLETRLENVSSELKSSVKKNGFIGKLWHGFKNLTGIGDSSKKVEKALKAEKSKISQINKPNVFKELTGEEYSVENLNKFLNGEIKLKSEKALQGYQEGQEAAVDFVGDMVSGIAAVGIYSLAVAAAPFTGGLSIAVGFGAAAVSGGLIKTGIKAAEAAVGGKEYDSFGKDFATGAFSGALGPLTGGIGGAVGKGIATKLGIQAVKAGVKEVAVAGAEQGVKQGAKQTITRALINPAGYEYIGGTAGKKVIAYGAEMATDGTLGGAIDGGFRAGLENDWDTGAILDGTISGGIGGAAMAPLIGGGMKGLGKLGHKLSGKNNVLIDAEGNKVKKLDDGTIVKDTGFENSIRKPVVLENIDLESFSKTGLPLEYTTKDLANNLKNIVNDLPIEKQKEILKKYNIELVYNEGAFFIRSIPIIPKSIKNTSVYDKKIIAELNNFTKNNKFKTNDEEINKLLNDFVEAAPEFLYTVGKKQHKTHDNTLDVHILKVLKTASEHPEYKKLSDEDRQILNMSILLHDISKEFIDIKTPDKGHAQACYKMALSILDRYDLPDSTKQRISKMVEFHEFFADYNRAYSAKLSQQSKIKNGSYVSERDMADTERWFNNEISTVVEYFKNADDFKLAKILAVSDLKSVNRQIYNLNLGYDNNVEIHGFHQKVTNTESDEAFDKYMKDALAFVDKEFEKYEGGIAASECVYPSEVRRISKEIFGNEEYIERYYNSQTGVTLESIDIIRTVSEKLNHLKMEQVYKNDLMYKLIVRQKNDSSLIDYERTMEFVDYYLKNHKFIKDHNIRLDYNNDLVSLKNQIDYIKQKEFAANIFKKYKLPEYQKNRLQNVLYTEGSYGEKVFNADACEAMTRMLESQKYTADEIRDIIRNSYTTLNHRYSRKPSNTLGYCYFNKEYFETVIKLAEVSDIKTAINDATFCLYSPKPDSGWVICPEKLNAVMEFNKLGIKDKSFMDKTIFEYEYSGNRYDNDHEIIAVKINDKEYQNAIKYAKQGFDGDVLEDLIATANLYDDNVVQMRANLAKRGVFPDERTGVQWINRGLFKYEGDKQVFDIDSYNFINKMLDTGIEVETLDDLVYGSQNSLHYAREFAPDKIVETGAYNKQQVEGLVRFFNTVGYSKYDSDIWHISDAFMDFNLSTEERAAFRLINDGNVGEYDTPFKCLNEEKLNQAINYSKRGVPKDNIKYLTKDVSLWNKLLSLQDLSFIKTKSDAILVKEFWHLKDVKSIDELSKTQRQELITLLMTNKSHFEDNNVKHLISILPATSKQYSALMRDLADSFGLNKPKYTQKEMAEIESLTSSLVKNLKNNTNPVEIADRIKTLVPEVNNKKYTYSINTLKKIVTNPEFDKLSESDKKIIIFSTLMHQTDLSKNTTDSAIDAYILALRMGFTSQEARSIYNIVQYSDLPSKISASKKTASVNKSRSYAGITSDEIKETFDMAAFNLKNYNDYALTRLLYNSKIDNKDLMRNVDNMLKKEIDRIKSSDIVLPQTDLKKFLAGKSKEWIEQHKKLVNGRRVIVINSDEIEDFYCLSHTTQAYNIMGKADVTTNISNFDAFAMFCDNKTICCSYIGNGKIAVVGPVGLLLRTGNTSQYIARGTDICSIAKDVQNMVNEYISRFSKIIVDKDHFQTKVTKQFDREWFPSMIKEELCQGYREMFNKKFEILNYVENHKNAVSEENLINFKKLIREILNNIEQDKDAISEENLINYKKQIQELEAKMKPADDLYRTKIDALIRKAGGKDIDIAFIRENDSDLAKAYDKVLSIINVDYRGDDGLMRTEYHNEVLASNTEIQGLYVTDEKYLMDLTDDYLEKAELSDIPIVIVK